MNDHIYNEKLLFILFFFNKIFIKLIEMNIRVRISKKINKKELLFFLDFFLMVTPFSFFRKDQLLPVIN